MKQLIILSVITGLAFLLFMVVLILGVVKKDKTMQIISIVLFISFVASGGYTAYCFASKAYHKVDETLKPRTGDQIYDALFDKRQYDCVKVIHSRDQVVPKIDYAIWLYFETCPQEFKRLLGRHEFLVTRVAAKSFDTTIPLQEGIEWFKPASLADTIVVYEYAAANSRSIQTFWATPDSTKVYCRDIWD